MNALSPKATFLTNKEAANAWQDIVASPLFAKAAEAARLHYAMNIGGPDTMGQSLTLVGPKLEGAKGVLNELIAIGRLSKPNVLSGDDNLEPI
jgi:hypothetical protein